MPSLKHAITSLYRAAEHTVNHDGIEHAGYLSFLGLLALFPFLVFLTALAGAVGHDVLQSDLIGQIIQYLPPSLIAALEPRMLEITNGPSQGLLTVAIVGALWTASSGVEGLRTVLNRAYRVHTPPSYLLRRLLSIAQLIVLATIIIVGMLFMVIWPVISSYLLNVLPFDFSEITTKFASLSYVISATLLFVVISVLYFVLPNVKQTWFAVLPGAALAAGLWMAAAKAMTFYISSFSQVNLIYGSLGGIIAALIFFYLLGVIFIFGAEYNYMLITASGERIEEKEAESATPPASSEKSSS